MAVAQAGRQMRCGCTQHYRPYCRRVSPGPLEVRFLKEIFSQQRCRQRLSLAVQHMSVDVSRPRQDLFADIVENQGFEIECMLSPILLFHGTLQQHCEL